MSTEYNQMKLDYVASFAEAWIEIPARADLSSLQESLPSRKRGLKYRRTPTAPPDGSRFLRGSVDWNNIINTCSLTTVDASFAEAWFEIHWRYIFNVFFWSLPSRKRGLKLSDSEIPRGKVMSLPSRKRGLKSMNQLVEIGTNMSLPSRKRGLKYKHNV